MSIRIASKVSGNDAVNVSTPFFPFSATVTSIPLSFSSSVAISAFRDAQNLSKEADAKINANYKELAQAIADIRVNEAVTASEIKCLATNTNAKIDALRAETQAAISLESERRQCGDQNLYSYVNGTFVPGNLIMPASSICPPVVLKGEK